MPTAGRRMFSWCQPKGRPAARPDHDRHRSTGAGGTPTAASCESSYMGAPRAGQKPKQRASRATGNRGSPEALDPELDFERYRLPACQRFIVMARAAGHHSFHDLDELAKDFYDDFWTEWLARPRRELAGPVVPYIAGAMMNKLRDLSRRGRSVRAPDILRCEADAILDTVASEKLEPAEQVVLQEEMWLVSDVVHELPAREQVAFAAVFGRDTRKKGSPLAGYKLAAAQLGVSETRAKKLSLSANKRIREAVAQIESGTWCERWASSIETVAAGGVGDPAFLRHARHCVQCRLGVVHLRRQAVILPAPVAVCSHDMGLLSRGWTQARAGLRTLHDEIVSIFGRHPSVSNEASGLVGGSGGAAGAGITAIKLGAVCIGVGLTGNACLQAVGVPSPIIAAVSGSHSHRARKHQHVEVPRRRSMEPHRAISMATLATTTHDNHLTVPVQPPKQRSSSPARTSPSTAAQREFNPGGGSGSQIPTHSRYHAPVRADTATSASATTTTTNTASATSKPATSTSGDSGGTVTRGSSNAFTAP